MKTWVLLRGLMRESRHWGDFIPKLQAAYPNDRLITIDWPGNGLLHQEKSLIHIRDMVGHIRQTLINQQCSGPFYVLAISLGAMAAVAWANAFPKEIRACILINTSLRPFNPFYHRLRLQSLPALIRLLFSDTAGKEIIILELTSTSQPQAALAQWIQFQKQFPVSRANILRQLAAAMLYRANKPDVPLLLLSGAKDQLVSPACSQTLAEKWQVPCWVHTQAGHDLPLDDGDWVLNKLALYLTSLH
ncbi:alpha/beta fold hydrolase [Iodobacter fluviatilis]|uniref:Acetoin dehydrogenase E2 subunit dihydrolipoyllysine-residue acetyltransferase n=1 Tax=Iodobacter fluviatilis TaxID=537 RepID=A0A377Q449_9NEIS|nr:alpha/beta hydrolase [Iodobacter fluviatilis]TCU90570.1 pimeloyl-ACP methyl ester carboxylesterase [Iodobacter fluviatilis]STQ89597.1 acetoin dehydrogenase E2 subunit dihydrolipoyllysine-residue acetyltransferase [Iodobacter fluviatilis]